MQKTSFTYKLSPDQQTLLTQHLKSGNYRPLAVPHTTIAVEGIDCRINLYESGKCLVQGKGAQEWITFVLEPEILREVRLGYEDVVDPEASTPHLGIDESGKGDYFGPLVIAAVYVDEAITRDLRAMNVRDSKTITSDRKAHDMARSIRERLDSRFNVVTIGPEAYNRLYASMKNVNRILAWGHARTIENMLDVVPACPRALSDQFGPTHQIQRALLKKGRTIRLDQRPRAESDPAVAAASILARSAFVGAIERMSKDLGETIPKGASDRVRAAAVSLVKKRGAEILLRNAKCHFRTTDAVLAEAGLDRSVLGELGMVTSKAEKSE